MTLKVRCLVLLIVAINCLIFPPPVQETYNPGHLLLTHACNLFQLPTELETINSQYYLHKILKRVNANTDCQRSLTFKKDIHTLITPVPTLHLKPEAYEIEINEFGIKISYSDYSGYVYALESLSQIIKGNSIPYAIIRDEPLLEYRGIMIDSARHFLGVAAIKRLIESMPLSKLNILHWHLVDDESFPIELGSHPELSQFGRYKSKQTYTTDDVKALIKAADLNAVKIIPEVDTPAHVRSWGLAPEWKNKNITIKCAGGTGYNGQFDVSNNEVFKLAQDVVREIDLLFKDSPYIHLGGDEVSSACWNLRPEIQNFMKLKNIKSYGELQMYWRFQLKQVLPPNRKVIFWRNDAQNVTTSETDILHYWGTQTDTANSNPYIIKSLPAPTARSSYPLQIYSISTKDKAIYGLMELRELIASGDRYMKT
jgi:hexosaminidase